MKSVKKLLCTLISAAVLFSCTPSVFAYQFPNALWQYDDMYNAAQASGDLYGLISAGEQALAVLANEPENETINSYRAGRTYEIAKAYEKLGMYEKSAQWYTASIPSNTAMNFEDAVKIARLKSQLYTPELNLYKQTHSSQVYHGAKNEHETGVLWGVTCDSETRDEFKNESMTMVYHNFGEEFNKYMETFLQKACDDNIAIEIALNVGNEAAGILPIKSQGAWLDGFLDILNKYNTVPVYLRFAGEVNVWKNQPNPEDFKDVFRFVANKVHERSPHIAVVYGLNFISDWNGDFNKYYPGDEYVDWVGVSLYMNKYFNGEYSVTDDQKISEQVFFAGDAAEPVHIMKEIVDLYGAKKPIMVFESGAAHYTRTLGEYSTPWAKNRVNELVNYLPMVYPQIKMQGYFNTIMPSENQDYALSSDNELKNYYISIVENAPHYIKDSYANDNAVSYDDCRYGFTVDQTVNTFGVYSYAYASSYKNVTYAIDGADIFSTDTLPYLCSVDFKDYAVGQHTMTVRSVSETGAVLEKSFPFTVTQNISIVVNGETLTGLDQPPVIVNGRTLVPVRAILQALGATVDWNDTEKKATAVKGDTSLELKIGSKTIMKNGSPYTADVASKIINSRTCIPARAVSELLNMTVSWDEATRTVYISE